MLVKKYHSEVVSIENPTMGVYTLELKPQSGRFKYLPGQFLHIALDEYDPSGAWPESRCFSIQTTPKEDMVKITYAVKGAFTRRMEKEIAVGKTLWLKLPFGDLFTQDHGKDNTVFIAGGTGITPFLSLFTDKSFAEYTKPRLYFGAKTCDFYFYDKEIEKAIGINTNLQVTCFYENEHGVIDISRILNESGASSTFFISGPLAMIKLFKQYLLSNGITEDRIKTDDWE